MAVAAALLGLGFDCGGDPLDDIPGDDCVVATNCAGGDHPNGCVCNTRDGEEYRCDLPGTKNEDNCCYDTKGGC